MNPRLRANHLFSPSLHQAFSYSASSLGSLGPDVEIFHCHPCTVVMRFCNHGAVESMSIARRIGTPTPSLPIPAPGPLFATGMLSCYFLPAEKFHNKNVRR